MGDVTAGTAFEARLDYAFQLALARPPNRQERNVLEGVYRDLLCFTMWMAGGGIKPGVTIGKSDEFGDQPAEDPIHMHDLHATWLHLLGIDHKQFTYRFQGRDFRLTDVHGNVLQNLLA